MPNSSLVLTVQREGEDNIVIVEAPSVGPGHTTLPRTRAPVEDTTMREITAQMVRFALSYSTRSEEGTQSVRPSSSSTDDALRELQELGGLIYSHLLTEPAREQLSRTETGFLHLRLQEQLLHVPWELAYTGETFLATKFWLGRQVLSEYHSARGFRDRPRREATEPLRVLVIGDPTEDLPEAMAEAEQVWKLLREIQGVEVKFLGGKQGVQKTPLLAKLSGYDVVHFAGHSFYQPQDPTLSGWRLADGTLTAGELSRLRYAPRLVFSNSCEAGETAEERSPQSYATEGQTAGLGSAFLDAGVQNYIGTLWKVDDTESREVATAFYQSLAAGRSSGEALCLARQHSAAKSGNKLTWASYVLYGDPAFTLMPSPEEPEEHKENSLHSRQGGPDQISDDHPSLPSKTFRPEDDRPQPERRAVLIPVLIVLLLLTGAGLVYWDAYHRLHEEYYANVTKRWGLPEGVGRLTDEQVQHRNYSLKFIKQGRYGPVQEIRVVNSRDMSPPVFAYSGFLALGYINPLSINTQYGGLSFSDQVMTRRVVFTRDADGRIHTQRAYNAANRPLYTLQYLQPDVAMYGEGAFAEEVRKSGITHVKFVRSETGPGAGLDQEIQFFGSDKQPRPNRRGIYGYRYVFNPLGLIAETIPLGVNGQPTEDTLGRAKFTFHYDALGNLTQSVDFDANGQRKPDASGAAEIKLRYDQYGNLLELAFLGEDESQPVTQKDLGAAIRTLAYDERGNIIEATFRGPNRQLVNGKLGFARQTIAWDEQGRTLEAYFGPDNKSIPVFGSNRVFQVRGVWDDRGYPAELTTLDENGEPVRGGELGCVTVRFTHDEHGNQIEINCRDEGDLPLRSTPGSVTVKSEFDERGNRTEAVYYGPSGHPDVYEETYVKRRWKYNEQNKVIEVAYFDAADNPCKSSEGYARWTNEYDDQGNVQALSFFDEHSQLTQRKGGYAKIVRTYDARNRMVTEATLDSDNTSTRNEDGYHKAMYEYDDRGYRTLMTYLDENDHPTLLKEGYAKARLKYNDEGKLLEETLLGLGEAPIVSKKRGYAKRRWTYDDRGNIAQRSFFDPQDQPKRNVAGYAMIRYFYDDLGREAKREFSDVDGEVVQTRVTVDEIEPNTKGERIGLHIGDQILSYDGEAVADTRRYLELEFLKGERPRELRLQRDGRIVSLDVPPGRITGITVIDSVTAFQKQAGA